MDFTKFAEDITDVAARKAARQENKWSEAAWTPACYSSPILVNTTTLGLFLLLLETTTTTTTILKPPSPTATPSQSPNPNPSPSRNTKRSLRILLIMITRSWRRVRMNSRGSGKWKRQPPPSWRAPFLPIGVNPIVTACPCSSQWGKRTSPCSPISANCRSVPWCFAATEIWDQRYRSVDTCPFLI